MRTKTLWIKDEYLQLILAGLKTVEVRVGYDSITRLQVGDRLLLNDRHPFVIQRIGRYASFEELLAHEDATAIAPDVPPGQLLERLRVIYPPEKEALGVVALEIKPEGKGSTINEQNLHLLNL
jgi:ASC-1-like (ASCH) protein